MQDFRAELLQQDEPEAKELALAIELFTHGSLNTFAKQTLSLIHISADAVDDLLVKVGNAPLKKFKVIERKRSDEAR